MWYQTRLVARQVEDPSKLGDIMPVGFGDEGMIDDELAEEEGGRTTALSGSQRRGRRTGSFQL